MFMLVLLLVALLPLVALLLLVLRRRPSWTARTPRALHAPLDAVAAACCFDDGAARRRRRSPERWMLGGGVRGVRVTTAQHDEKFKALREAGNARRHIESVVFTHARCDSMFSYTLDELRARVPDVARVVAHAHALVRRLDDAACHTYDLHQIQVSRMPRGVARAAHVDSPEGALVVASYVLRGGARVGFAPHDRAYVRAGELWCVAGARSLRGVTHAIEPVDTREPRLSVTVRFVRHDGGQGT